MEALHAAGGVPPGWRFALPAGDAQAGRKVFVDFKCYACHAVKGEQFPGESSPAGPELTGMGGHHPAEYLAESIVNPSAVIVDAPGYASGDGRSIMPASPDMTIGQLVDLVAYLRSLSPSGHGHAHETAREQTVGAYRVRLAYRQAGDDHSSHAQSGGKPMTAAAGRLMVFVADAASGQPIAYVPVTAKIEVEGKPAQTRKLTPMVGAGGLYYGAEVVLPARTRRITLSVGPSTAQVEAGAPEGLKRRETAAFDWQ